MLREKWSIWHSELLKLRQLWKSQKYIWICAFDIFCNFLQGWQWKSEPWIVQKSFPEGSCSAGLAVNPTPVEIQGIFPFSIPTRKASWIFLLQKLSPSTFKLLSEMQGSTTTCPGSYLDLGNEFSWAVLKSRPSTSGLWDICSGEKHRILFTTQVIPPSKQKERETNRNCPKEMSL